MCDFTKMTTRWQYNVAVQPSWILFGTWLWRNKVRSEILYPVYEGHQNTSLKCLVWKGKLLQMQLLSTIFYLLFFAAYYQFVKSPLQYTTPIVLNCSSNANLRHYSFSGRGFRDNSVKRTQVLRFRKSLCFELNLKSSLSGIVTFSRDLVSTWRLKPGAGIKVDIKMSKISKLFKGSSSSSSSRPSSSSGSSSRSKHRSRSGPSPQEAINRLRETEAMLTKKQEYLESRIQQEITIAKKNGTKNKRGKKKW